MRGKMRVKLTLGHLKVGYLNVNLCMKVLMMKGLMMIYLKPMLTQQQSFVGYKIGAN